MSSIRLQRALAAENTAAAYLRGLGREIIARNWRCREGEIDIITRQAEGVAFVEVRCLSDGSHKTPEESVNTRKRRKLMRAAESWVSDNNWEGGCRFDVIEMRWHDGRASVTALIEGAFDADLNPW